MKKIFKYYIYDMCGNVTALVDADDISKEVRKIINDEIMKENNNVEQVGFVSLKEYKLTMAGGEFCGNATRGSAYYYLNGKKGEINLKVANDIVLKAGVDENGKAWTDMPLYSGKEFYRKASEGIYEIRLNGISFIILDEEKSEKYLKDKLNIKENAMEIIKKYNKSEAEAIGVIFEEKVKKDGIENIKINPIVWVKSIDTLFYENACGSGTTAVGILESIKDGRSKNLDIIQPSNEIITTNIIVNEKEKTIEKITICGGLYVDENEKKLMIEI
ncbi:MAG: hypothetical protein J6M60_01005 [Clostridia bacterium]|nr:hypothetical protein [Clostridia bacterium]